MGTDLVEPRGVRPLLVVILTLGAIGCGAADSGSSGTSGGSGGGGAAAMVAPPAGWLQWEVARGGNDHWYGIYRKAGDWQLAQTAAQAFSTKAYLATVTSDAEQQFLATTFFAGADRLSVFWLGGTTPTHDRLFTWITGEPFVYTHWKSGEPNNWSGAEYFLCINWTAVRGQVGEWNDVDLAGTIGFDSGANDGPYQAILESDVLPRSM
jgi:hypothetical protein